MASAPCKDASAPGRLDGKAMRLDWRLAITPKNPKNPDDILEPGTVNAPLDNRWQEPQFLFP